MTQSLPTNLSFVTLHTPDYPRAKAFLVDVLRFTPTEERPGANAFVSENGAGLALRENLDVQSPLGQGVTIFFTVPDLQTYYAQVVEGGAQIVEPIHDMPFGATFTLATPDGHWLGFWQGET
ncbi:hypothetical protein GCM10017783_25790 [Deinococcus piscis]|uniref:VOC domain-containing protein n=1 Tax=Deinococcus piscis TaxID=394230 RepID=A0ABQ3KC77_9DEIO|nr:VOC family protein [Deinococcus piscis]GHG12583.1 hypothetical protein GCM10017783_25790 [Deinococcus piscis]